jgi:hypothetical protein
LIPPEVRADAQATAATRSVEKSAGQIGALLIVLAWIVLAGMLLYLFLYFTKRI